MSGLRLISDLFSFADDVMTTKMIDVIMAGLFSITLL